MGLVGAHQATRVGDFKGGGPRQIFLEDQI